MFNKKQILIILFCVNYCVLSAQETQIKIPKKAGLYSAILPGFGQAYTKKYWKIPIIYAGLITSVYYINESNETYQLYKKTYINRVNGNKADEFQGVYSDYDLKTLARFYRRNREVSTLFFIGTYLLNIIDASVSAHLFNYDISDNLTLKIEPKYLLKENISVVSFSLNL